MKTETQPNAPRAIPKESVPPPAYTPKFPIMSALKAFTEAGLTCGSD